MKRPARLTTEELVELLEGGLVTPRDLREALRRPPRRLRQLVRALGEELRARPVRRRTTRAELFALHRRICAEAFEIQRAKNAEYGTAEDALQNFRQAGAAGVDAPRGVFARLSDKHGRLGRAAAGEIALNPEDVRDAINLLVDLEAALLERGDR